MILLCLKVFDDFLTRKFEKYTEYMTRNWMDA